MAARLIAPPMAFTAGPPLCQSRPPLDLNQAWRAEDELGDRQIIATWDCDDSWPSV